MRYFTGFLIAIGLIILIFVIILKGGGKASVPPINLNSYANSDAIVQLIIDGPINADQNHQEIEIDISQSENSIQLLKGYQGTVASSKLYQNNQEAYAVFLHALTLDGFTKGVASSSDSDERGYCATGERYILELTNGGNTIARYWATSCGGQGTYKGNVTATLNLFEQQIPDFATLTQNFDY
jgi:hypothetical protein